LPVGAVFQVDVSTTINYKHRELLTKLIKRYDEIVNGIALQEDILPEVMLPRDNIFFSNVRYNGQIDQFLEIKNVGKSVVEYTFVPKPMEDQVSKPWLRVHPKTGLIIPGGSAQVKFSCLVDKNTAQELNSSDGSMDDTLIIHIENGKEIFIHVRGNFLRSCYGTPLQDLVCFFEPVRFMKIESFNRVRNSRAIAKPAIPKELWRVIDYILKYGMREESLFQESGNVVELQQLREKLDTGESFSEFTGSIHSMVECLMTLLESLPESVIPSRYYKKIIENAVNKAKLDELLDTLPPVHYNCFHYVMAFLRELLLNSDANKLTPDTIANGFSQLILPSPQNLEPEKFEYDAKAKLLFLKLYLIEDLEMSKKEDKDLFKPVK